MCLLRHFLKKYQLLEKNRKSLDDDDERWNLYWSSFFCFPLLGLASTLHCLPLPLLPLPHLPSPRSPSPAQLTLAVLAFAPLTYVN